MSSPLRLALFGATGGTGSLVLRQALDAGHHVTVLVRTRARLSLSHPNLTVLEGSVMDRDLVVQAVQGANAVVCALGAPPSSKDRIRERGTQIIVDAMQAAGVQRLVVQSSHGIGETAHELPWLMRWIIVPFYLKGAFEDHERQEEVVRASDLDWTLVRPPHLSNAGPATALAYGGGFDPTQMTMKIARTDVARFLLRQAETTPPTRETVVVSTATPQVAAGASEGAFVAVAA